MSLRARRIEQAATLPDGRAVVVGVGLARDPYVPDGENETVAVELRADGEVLAVVNTVLDPEQDGEALALARELASRLEAGTLEPTAGAIEPLADTPR